MLMSKFMLKYNYNDRLYIFPRWRNMNDSMYGDIEILNLQLSGSFTGPTLPFQIFPSRSRIFPLQRNATPAIGLKSVTNCFIRASSHYWETQLAMKKFAKALSILKAIAKSGWDRGDVCAYRPYGKKGWHVISHPSFSTLTSDLIQYYLFEK